MSKKIFWYNGKLIESQTLELDIDDPGLLYGATIFTTLRVYGNSLDSSLTNWRAHCDRLKFSLQTFGWQQPDWNLVRQGAEIMLAHFPVLRITVFPDGREWIIGRFLPPNLTEQQKNGVSCALAKLELARSLPGHKTGNYLSPWLAKISAQSLNAQEAILVDTAGNWLETSTGNLWGWRNGSWCTPPLAAGILPGVMGKQLINWLQKHQLTVQETPWTGELVQDLEAIAYTNSVVEIIPVHTVIQPTGSLEYDPYHQSFTLLRGLFLP
ncbi:aminotransferase class IV [Cylindrospermum sp. FACHB-282]|uniref:aminotransferase class IV n=1 Tax=Cylindrospermum sp. FACHB-282 TaxID=2692794 RepID=UPI001688BB43|nr:aminotransferase class IV [Cylindrospermum sp. FACHB-282]MBD2384950.1 aminotransferase class IV [Cylindrospermum sp. FACHB-282]